MRTIRYAQTQDDPPDDKVDGYLERLLKYVPAEVITLFIALLGLTSVRDNDVMLGFATGVAIVVTPLYLFATSRQVEEAKRPHWIMYVLSPIAFVIWAIYVHESVRTLSPVDVDEGWATFLLIVGVFVIPLVDMAIDQRAKVQNPT